MLFRSIKPHNQYILHRDGYYNKFISRFWLFTEAYMYMNMCLRPKSVNVIPAIWFELHLCPKKCAI